MDGVRDILNQLIELYNSDKNNDEKHLLGSKLWTEYYKLSKENNISLDEGYHLYLMLENESYIINQSPNRKEIDNQKLLTALNNLNEVLDNEIMNGGISLDDAIILLDWVVENARRSYEILGIDVSKNSLNGFCEIGQALSIMPLEKLGLEVTKNTATDAFSYPFNHCFGTVVFPILENDEVVNKRFLIDTTYRQFFSTVRCNLGRYDTKEENTFLDASPDPGYFIEDIDFAKELMAKGYVELDNNSAKKYGEAFYLSALKKNEARKDQTRDYLSSIVSSNSFYRVADFELEGLNLEFPDVKKHTAQGYK